MPNETTATKDFSPAFRISNEEFDTMEAYVETLTHTPHTIVYVDESFIQKFSHRPMEEQLRFYQWILNQYSTISSPQAKESTKIINRYLCEKVQIVDAEEFKNG